MKKISAIIIGLFITVPCSYLYALNPSKPLTAYAIDVWDESKGLSARTISAILQTHDGYMWLATDEGLIRFDGVQFTVFDYNNTPQIPDNYITSLAEDGNGNLWFGTMRKGLCKYSPPYTFTNYSINDGLPDDQVYSILVDKHNNLWVETHAGVCEVLHCAIDKRDSVKQIIHDPESKFLTFPGKAIEDREGNIFLNFRGLRKKIAGKDSLELLLSRTVNYITEDTAGVVWFSTRKEIYKMEKGTVVACKEIYNKTKEAIMGLCFDKKGALWIPTSGNGIFRMVNGEVSQLTLDDGLRSNTILSCYDDDDGNVWMGTHGAGLIRLKDKQFETITMKDGLSDNAVYSIYEDMNGAMWIGTKFGGVNKLDFIDKTSGKINNETIRDFRITARYDTNNGLRSNFIRSICQGNDGRMLLGTPKGFYTLQNNVWKYYDNHLTPEVEIRLIYKDLKKNVWVGSLGHGPQTFGLSKFENNTLIDDYFGKVVESNLRAACEDKQGNLWFGTQYSINRISKNDTTTFTEKDGLLGTRCFYLFCDNNGGIWVSEYGNGLQRFNPDGRDSNKFSHIGKRNGLSEDVIYSIVEDDSGNLWFGGDKGIFRAKKQDLIDVAEHKTDEVHCISYGREDGFPPECNGGSYPSVCKSGDGKFWFPTPHGVLIVDPKNIRTNQTAPKVYIEKIYGSEDTVMPRSNEDVTLSIGTRKIEIHYTALNFFAPEKIGFRYKLEGIDEDWVQAGTQRKANYTNISPGEYIFQVTACNNEGIWSEQYATIFFTIPPHYWETWWFRISGVCSLVFLVMFIFQKRVRTIRQEEKRKTFFATQLADVEMKALRAQMNPHFIFNCLNSIQECIVSGENENAYKYLSKFARLLRLILEYSDKKSISLDQELIALELYLALESLRFDKKFDCHITVGQFIDKEDVKIPPMLIQPYVENAIWHGLLNKEGERQLNIKITQTELALLCVIEDNGIGRKKAGELRHKKNIPYESKGMKVTKDRMEIINKTSAMKAAVNIIDLFTDENEAAGTRVEIVLPLKYHDIS